VFRLLFVVVADDGVFILLGLFEGIIGISETNESSDDIIFIRGDDDFRDFTLSGDII